MCYVSCGYNVSVNNFTVIGQLVFGLWYLTKRHVKLVCFNIVVKCAHWIHGKSGIWFVNVMYGMTKDACLSMWRCSSPCIACKAVYWYLSIQAVVCIVTAVCQRLKNSEVIVPRYTEKGEWPLSRKDKELWTGMWQIVKCLTFEALRHSALIRVAFK